MKTSFSIIINAFVFLFCCPWHQQSFSQDLSAIGDQQALTVNGYVSTNQVLNLRPVTNGNTRQNPYNGYYTGNVNFNLYGVNVPFTFIYSNQKTNFTHPFNQYGLHPSYKWIKGHIGYASMNFSRYTMNGYLFAGAGVEATPPGIFRISAMYGRLQKENLPETDSAAFSTMSYKRMGYAIKAGIETDNDKLFFILFNAKDYHPHVFFQDTLPLLPQENTAVSVIFSKQILEGLSLNAELATSALTKDLTTENTINQEKFNPATWFLEQKSSTITRNAMKAGLSYSFSNSSIGIGYERVDPDYQTLGAYYFTNNLENATINFSTGLFDNKISINANTGLQRDNLDKTNINNSNRFVGSASVNTNPVEALNLGLSYSNFTSYTNARSTFDYINQTSPYETYDTLNYRQISQSVNLNGSYSFTGNEERTQSISLNLNYQLSNDQSAGDHNYSDFYNLSLSHVYGIKPMELTFTSGMNMNVNRLAEVGTTTLGPSFTTGKSFFERSLKTNLNINYNTTLAEKSRNGDIINIRGSVGMAIKKQHNINFSALYQFRKLSNNQKTNTIALTLTYAYNFDIIKDKKQDKKEEEK